MGFRGSSQFFVLCGFVLLFSLVGGKKKASKLSIAKLNKELRAEPTDFFVYHLTSIFTVAAFGDRLYAISKEQISLECLATANATMAMSMRLTIGQRVNTLLNNSITEVTPLFKSRRDSEHPLELVCRKLKRVFAEQPDLKVAFEKTKNGTLKGFTGGRPPYANSLFTNLPSLGMFLMKKLTFPELARIVTNEEVQNQLIEEGAFSNRTHLFVKSIVAVTGKKEFGESMQSLYEESLDEVVPLITAQDVDLHTLVLEDEKTFWFLPEILKMFYNNLTKKKALKKEVEDMAAVVGKGYDKSDLDFSKIRNFMRSL